MAVAVVQEPYDCCKRHRKKRVRT